MLIYQSWRISIKFALLIIFTSTILLYYVANRKETLVLKSYSFKKVLKQSNELFVKQYLNVSLWNQTTTPQTDFLKLQRYDGKVFRFGTGTEKIKIAVVLCGERLNQTLVTLKSARLFSKKRLHFILVVDDANYDIIKYKLFEWPTDILKLLSFEIHPISFPNGTEGEEWKKLFKLCACQRLFLPSLLPDIDSLIYIDTDVLFMRPVENLWEYFYQMNNTQIAALCPEHEDFATGWYNRFARHPFYEPLGVNSGVMLMNLTRMRTFQWEKYLAPIMKEYKLNIVWGDQDIINIIFHFHSDKLYILPCEWNYRPDHCMYSSVCKTAEKNGVAVIHGNRGVFHNSKQPAFKAIYKSMTRYTFGKFEWKYNEILNLMKLSLKESSITNCGKHLSTILSKISMKFIR